MKRSWKDKLDEQGVKLVEMNARLGQIPAPKELNLEELRRFVQDHKTVLSSYSDGLAQKRKAQLSAEFINLYHRAHPELDIPEQMMRLIFERTEWPVKRAEQLEMTQRITMFFEANQSWRITTYEFIALLIIFVRDIGSVELKRHFGTGIPTLDKLRSSIAQLLEWSADLIRGRNRKPPGRVNIELARFADAVLKHQKEPLTQIELYEALKAGGAALPEDPEAFRLWLHRARRDGLIKNFQGKKSKAKSQRTPS